MGSLPVVAICGRPNVGKSTLFNLLAQKRIAIVDPTSGVTRDRISTIANIGDKYFELVDTGGIGIVDEMELDEAIHQQIQVALQRADIILFMVDITDRVTPLDIHIATLLRKYQKKILLLANKTDSEQLDLEKDQFRKLGFGDAWCISATTRRGIADLKEQFAALLPKTEEVPQELEEIKIAVVGRPNSGKSTFINALAQEERVIVSEIPGTTRDSVDVRFEKDGKSIIAIDTAGLKRRKNIDGNIDFYSQNRAQKAIKRADIAILMIDATSKVLRIDKDIANFIVDEYKPAIITINKWDLVPDIPTSRYETYLSKLIPRLMFAPLSFITAKDAKNVPATIDLARSLYKQARQHISTGKLNRTLKIIVDKKAPRYRKGKQGKIYYATQTGNLPPSFLLFVNDPKLFSAQYKRYLLGQFQQRLGFPEIPVKIAFKARRDKEDGPEITET